jgi:hypothetical protein
MTTVVPPVFFEPLHQVHDPHLAARMAADLTELLPKSPESFSMKGFLLSRVCFGDQGPWIP